LSCLDSPSNDSPLIKSINILHTKSKRQINLFFLRLQQIERFKHGRTLVPFHSWTQPGNVLAVLGRSRNKNPRFQPELFYKLSVLAFNRRKFLLGEIGQIHFVDHYHELFNPKQTE